MGPRRSLPLSIHLTCAGTLHCAYLHVGGEFVPTIRVVNHPRPTKTVPYSAPSIATTVKGFVSRFLVVAPTGSSGAFRVVSGGTDCDNYTTDHAGLVDIWPTGDYYDDYKEVTARVFICRLKPCALRSGCCILEDVGYRRVVG